MSFDDLALRVHHDEDVVIYINGIKILERSGYRTDYRSFPAQGVSLDEALRPGKNVVALHCRQTVGGQFIDFGLVKRVPREAEIEGRLE
jgi:hypothetical protein